MAFEQTQVNCGHCGKPTLHTRSTEDFPHMLHLLISVFLCGLWIPVWVILTIISENAGRGVPFRCSTCGQAAQWAQEPRILKPLAGLLLVVALVGLFAFILALVL